MAQQTTVETTYGYNILRPQQFMVTTTFGLQQPGETTIFIPTANYVATTECHIILWPQQLMGCNNLVQQQ